MGLRVCRAAPALGVVGVGSVRWVFAAELDRLVSRGAARPPATRSLAGSNRASGYSPGGRYVNGTNYRTELKADAARLDCSAFGS
jgi:hypothetical protein